MQWAITFRSLQYVQKNHAAFLRLHVGIGLDSLEDYCAEEAVLRAP